MNKENILLKSPLKLVQNRVRRTYKGGKMIDEWLCLDQPEDNNRPEEWVASIVEARNSDPISGEGLSRITMEDGSTETLKAIINQNPEYYLGARHINKYGESTAVLTKLLDSAVRLSIQVHPTKAYAREHFKSQYGKTEAWFIIGGRAVDGEEPYVLAGFKPGVTRQLWKRYFEEQDIEAMISSLHKFYVKPGEVFLINGGFPHAIGSGCFLIEIQEPTDYTMRIERKAFDGSMLTDLLCHQGVGFELMLDCFDYNTLSEKKTKAKCFKFPQIISEENGNQLISLISEKDTPCFAMNKLIVKNSFSISDQYFKSLIILSGSGTISTSSGKTEVQQGESLFLPAGLGWVGFTSSNNTILEVILCYPPK